MMWDEKAAMIIAAIAFAVGVIGGATVLGEAWRDAKKVDRYVTVRGVSEKDVKADLAVWPIRVRVAGNELAEANKSADEARKKVLTFLNDNGVKLENVASQNQRVEDRQAKDYDQGKATYRYLVEYTILVRTTEVDKVQKISQMTDKLASAGVVLSSQGNWDRSGPQFMFTQLNAIKPDMMASATKSAREVATQFAEDSGSNLRSIRRASQGLFSINDRDRTTGTDGSGGGSGTSDINKKIRVVVTVDYYID